MRRGDMCLRARGFTYVWALMAIALLSLGLAAVGPVWSQAVKRDRERELLRVGVLYAQAIERYYHAMPGKQFPQSLEQLLLDARFAGTMRHLRSLYFDPMTPGQPFDVVRSGDGRVIGVRSRSVNAPLLSAPWTDGRHQLPVVERYSDWQFLAKVDG